MVQNRPGQWLHDWGTRGGGSTFQEERGWDRLTEQVEISVKTEDRVMDPFLVGIENLFSKWVTA